MEPESRSRRKDYPDRAGMFRMRVERPDRLSASARRTRVLLLLGSLPLSLSLITATFSSHELEPHGLSRRGELGYAWARAHLESPFTEYGPFDDLGVSEFDAILLSNLASGLMNVAQLEGADDAEFARLSREVARRALSIEPPGVHAGRNIGENNLYASHLLLILGIEHHLMARVGEQDEEHDAIAERTARHLAAASLGHPTAHAPSYPGSARWPADQAVTLAALDLFDHEYGTTLSVQPIARWLRWIHAHQIEGLPWSATGGLSYARIPRGCALSFLSLYVGRFAPEEGARIYAAYREAHGIDWLGWRGFREWPEDQDGGSDVDAGPVLFGWGTAATGIGLGAARLYRDRGMVAGIERIADTVGGPVPFSARYLLAPTLGQAMLFAGETTTSWDERPVPMRGDRDAGWPIGAGLSLVVLGLAQVLLVRGLRRR